jgi:hypothetical protein
VEVTDWQQFGLAVGEPARSGQPLTLGAVAVAARVVYRSLMPALVALFEVATQSCGATTLDGGHNPLVLQWQGVPLPVSDPILAEDVGDLIGRPGVGRSEAHDG